MNFLLNYLSLDIFIAATAGFLISMLWYSPALFGKAWIREMNFEKEKPMTGSEMAAVFIATFIFYVFMIAVLNFLLGHFYIAKDIFPAMMLAFILWSGFVGTMGMVNAMYAKKTMKLFLIDSGNQVMVFITAAAILTHF